MKHATEGGQEVLELDHQCDRSYVSHDRSFVEGRISEASRLRGNDDDGLGGDQIAALAAKSHIGGTDIPHEEHLFSVFQHHTRWVSKGKAGRPIELEAFVMVVRESS